MISQIEEGAAPCFVSQLEHETFAFTGTVRESAGPGLLGPGHPEEEEQQQPRFKLEPDSDCEDRASSSEAPGPGGVPVGGGDPVDPGPGVPLPEPLPEPLALASHVAQLESGPGHVGEGAEVERGTRSRRR